MPRSRSNHEQTAEDYGVSGFTGCSRTPQSETRDSLQTPSQGSRPRTGPVAAADCGSCLRRNVVSERERRRRISLSCERLRALLPQFDGRREDMASILEMAVYFLQLAHSMAPDWEQLSVPQPSQEMWHMWQGDVLQVALEDQMEDSKSDSGIAKASTARVQDSPCCGMLGMDQSQAMGRVSELLERPSSPSEPSSLSPGLSPWLPHSWQLASPQTSDIISSGLHPVGSLARDTESPGMLDEENLVLTSVPDARYTPGAGSDVVDGAPFLLTTNPDWWLGEWGCEPRLPFPTPALALGPVSNLTGPGRLCPGPACSLTQGPHVVSLSLSGDEQDDWQGQRVGGGQRRPNPGHKQPYRQGRAKLLGGH